MTAIIMILLFIYIIGLLLCFGHLPEYTRGDAPCGPGTFGLFIMNLVMIVILGIALDGQFNSPTINQQINNQQPVAQTKSTVETTH
jgi:hypothetical protein